MFIDGYSNSFRYLKRNRLTNYGRGAIILMSLNYHKNMTMEKEPHQFTPDPMRVEKRFENLEELLEYLENQA